VLARDPLAPRRSEMATSYLEVARGTSYEDADTRLALLRKALRLDPAHEGHARTEAEIAFTEAKNLEAQGRPDAFLLRRALELDPGHQGAKEALDSFEQRVVTPPTSNVRWAAVGGIGAGALVIAGAIALWGRKRPRGKPPVSRGESGDRPEPPPTGERGHVEARSRGIDATD